MRASPPNLKMGRRIWARHRAVLNGGRFWQANLSSKKTNFKTSRVRRRRYLYRAFFTGFHTYSVNGIATANFKLDTQTKLRTTGTSSDTGIGVLCPFCRSSSRKQAEKGIALFRFVETENARNENILTANRTLWVCQKTRTYLNASTYFKIEAYARWRSTGAYSTGTIWPYFLASTTLNRSIFGYD